jgi:hypothetical protein
VFVLGIKVLLKGLTWPGVINSWFLGTVRGLDREEPQERNPNCELFFNHARLSLSLSQMSRRGEGELLLFGT